MAVNAMAIVNLPSEWRRGVPSKEQSYEELGDDDGVICSLFRGLLEFGVCKALSIITFSAHQCSYG